MADFKRNEVYDEPYIHLTWKGFKERYKSPSYKTLGDGADLKKIYTEQSRKAKRRFAQAMGGMTEEQAGDVMAKIGALYDIWTSEDAKDAVQKNFLLDVKKVMDEVQRSGMYKTLHHKKVPALIKDIEALNRAFEAQKKILDEIKELDKRMIEYYQRKVGQTFSSLTTPLAFNDGYEFLTMSGRGLSTVQKWESAWSEVEKAIREGASLQGKSINYTSYKHSNKLKTIFSSPKTDPIEKVVSNTFGQMSVVKGAIWEIAFASVLRGGIQEIARELRSAGADVSISGPGDIQLLGGDKIEDPVLGLEVTRKTDTGLTVTRNGDGVKVNLGFSLKSQKTDGPSRTTTFLGKTSYERILERAELKNSYVEAVMNNLLAHRRYSETANIRKLIAAHMALTAIGGAENDQVYWLVYLDKVITLPDVLMSMAENSSSGKGVLNLTLNSPSPKSLVGEEKRKEDDIMDRWKRSHESTQLIRGYTMSITGRTSL